jgi:molybdate transport system substrate-binding protein
MRRFMLGRSRFALTSMWMLVLALVGVSTACDRGGRPPLVVFAASSLQASTGKLEALFRAQQPDVDVVFSFGGTQQLRMQIEHGAHAQVLMAADDVEPNALHAAGMLSSPVLFAHNDLVIVQPMEATKIGGVDELVDAARVVIGAEAVPVGKYARLMLSKVQARRGDDFRARVEAHVVSHELDASKVLMKVILGEADAGIVYRSDVRGRTNVHVVDVEPADNVVTNAMIGLTTTGEANVAARAWQQLVLSSEGQQVLAEHGFRRAVHR